MLDRAGVAAGVAFVLVATLGGVWGAAVAPVSGAHTASMAIPFALTAIVAPLCALIACGVGVINWWRARRTPHSANQWGDPNSPPRRSRRFAVAAMSLGVMELTITALVAMLAYQPAARGLEDNRRAICQTQLQRLGRALTAAASKHADGRFPDSLADLKTPAGKLDAAFVCPADPSPGVDGSYHYLGKGLSTKPSSPRFASPQTVLAYESPGHHAGGFHLLLGDRTVLFVEGAQAEAIKRELTLGQNPPPSGQAK